MQAATQAMNSSTSGRGPIRVDSAGHAVFAVMMIGLGVASLLRRDFAPIWQPTPRTVPARAVVVWLCVAMQLVSGAGLLWRRSAPFAARLAFAYLLAWLVLFRGPPLFRAPLAQDSWSGWSETAVIVAGAWALYSRLAPAWDRRHLGPVTGENGRRGARVLFGLALIPFGLAHFNYPRETASLVPGWLPAHLAWVYVTGGAFLAAAGAVLAGAWARLAAGLVAVQLGLFTLLVWVPAVAAGPSAFQWSEFVISAAVTAGAWAVADSCGRPAPSPPSS